MSSGEVDAVLTGLPRGARALPLRPRDPRQLGGYELIGRLGEGGMGRVYLARAQSGQLVAVKVLREAIAEDEEFLRRFRGEVARAAQVPPFCTAEVLDADVDHDPPYLVVEFVDGPSLADVVDMNGPLTPANLHGLAVGMAAALTAIHGAGVIHRDLKPSNVLLAPGTPKVIDFGISRPIDGTMTQSSGNHVMGTVAYMSPERFGADASRTLTPAADIFSWGAVVTFAGTGRVPFPADSLAQIAVRIMTDPPELSGLTGPLRSLVERALAKEPRDRPTARDLLDELTRAGKEPLTLAEDPVTAVVPAPRRRWLGRAIGMVVAGLALLGTLGVVSGLIPVPGRHTPPVVSAGTEPPGSPSPSPAPSVPAGFQQVLTESLNRPGRWQPTNDPVHQATCDVHNGLVVTMKQPGPYRCKGWDEALTNLAVYVDVTLVRPGSCGGIWFRFSGGGFLLQVCADGLHLYIHGVPDTTTLTILHNLWKSPLAVGDTTRIGVVAVGNNLRFYRDGQFIGEQEVDPDSAVGSGHVVLGLFGHDPAPGPYQVRLANVAIWSDGT